MCSAVVLPYVCTQTGDRQEMYVVDCQLGLYFFTTSFIHRTASFITPGFFAPGEAYDSTLLPVVVRRWSRVVVVPYLHH